MHERVGSVTRHQGEDASLGSRTPSQPTRLLGPTAPMSHRRSIGDAHNAEEVSSPNDGTRCQLTPWPKSGQLDVGPHVGQPKGIGLKMGHIDVQGDSL